MTETLIPFGADEQARVDILTALKKLALTRGAELDAAARIAYLEALAGTDATVITRACLYLSRQPKDPYAPHLPSAGDILAMVGRLEAEQLRYEQAQTREWKTECRDGCDDTGWKIYTCRDGMRCGRYICDHSGIEHTHPYAEPCVCRPTNRTWARNHPIIHKVAK